MKNIIKITSIIFIGYFFIGCAEISYTEPENLNINDDFFSVEINNEYRIQIPNYMKESDNLNDDASLQYQNIFKETYIIIIDDPKDTLISIYQELEEYDDSISAVKNYREIHLKSLQENMEILSLSEPKPAKIKGLESEFVEMEAHVEGIPHAISYFLTFVEGDEKLYLIMAWTLSNRKKKYKPTFEKTTNSFRLI